MTILQQLGNYQLKIILSRPSKTLYSWLAHLWHLWRLCYGAAFQLLQRNLEEHHLDCTRTDTHNTEEQMALILIKVTQE